MTPKPPFRFEDLPTYSSSAEGQTSIGDGS